MACGGRERKQRTRTGEDEVSRMAEVEARNASVRQQTRETAGSAQKEWVEVPIACTWWRAFHILRDISAQIITGCHIQAFLLDLDLLHAMPFHTRRSDTPKSRLDKKE